MGETEDTFTKQEIQAGYVTSGRDVLARQQQIVAQALAAGQMVGSRRRVGGGLARAVLLQFFLYQRLTNHPNRHQLDWCRPQRRLEGVQPSQLARLRLPFRIQ
jgi:hypothetical protein